MFRFVEMASGNMNYRREHERRASPNCMEVCLVAKSSGYLGRVGAGDITKGAHTRKAGRLVEESESGHQLVPATI
jgi:hypothetical protein